MVEQDVLTAVLFQMGGGAVLGFATGYATKKVLKLALLVLGLFTMGLLYLQYKGIVDVNYDALASMVENTINATTATASGIKTHVIANMPFAASFIAAFWIGFKYG